MSTEAQAQISLYIDGIGNLGVFEVASGRTAGTEVAKYTPGGTAEEVAIPGGRKTREDQTFNRVKLLPRDPALLAQLDQKRGNFMKATEQPLDADYNPSGSPIVWSGLYMEYTWPDVDSGSNDPARLQIVMSPTKLAA